MYKLCKTEQSAQRQRQLEKGLLDMMLQHRYEDISVSDLCDYLDVPRKSFYRYFSSKEGALYAMLDHSMMDFYTSKGNPAGALNGSQIGDLNRYFAFWLERRDLLNALLRNNLGGTLVERAMDLSMREQLMPIYMKNMPKELQHMALSFAVTGLLSMVIQWHHQGFKTTVAEMTRIAEGILTRPLIQ
jgi:AcrR family transcriptional regulator